MLNINHIIAFYDEMTAAYTDASQAGIPVGHIAEFYLERWWSLWISETIVPVEDHWELAS